VVNISARQLQEPDFVETVADAIRSSGIRPDRLTLEITESALMADLDQSAATLHRLRGLGVRLAIDDFGTGYSSLSYLERLPVEVLKIDRSFNAAIGHCVCRCWCAHRRLGQTLHGGARRDRDCRAPRLRAIDCRLGQASTSPRPARRPGDRVARRGWPVANRLTSSSSTDECHGSALS
jgi:hypothetical protein